MLISFISLIIYSMSFSSFLKEVNPTVNKIISEVENSYPPGLEVTIKNGIVSTNVEEPFYLAVDGENFAVIDTYTPYSGEAFNKFNTPVWVTRDSIFYRGSEKEVKVINLTDVTDFKLDRNLILTAKEKIIGYVPLLAPFLYLMMLIFVMFSYTFRLVYNFFLALLIWITLKLMGRRVAYGDAYKIGLYSMTTAFIVNLILTFTAWQGFTFMFTLISLMVVIVNFASVDPKSLNVDNKPQKS